MRNYNISIIKGDGIGPEIVDEAIKVLNAVAKKCDFMMLVNNFYDRHNVILIHDKIHLFVNKHLNSSYKNIFRGRGTGDEPAPSPQRSMTQKGRDCARLQQFGK